MFNVLPRCKHTFIIWFSRFQIRIFKLTMIIFLKVDHCAWSQSRFMPHIWIALLIHSLRHILLVWRSQHWFNRSRSSLLKGVYFLMLLLDHKVIFLILLLKSSRSFILISIRIGLWNCCHQLTLLGRVSWLPITSILIY